MAAIPGYKIALNRAGTPTTANNESLSGTTVANQYQIDNTDRRALDRRVVPTFYSAGIAIGSSAVKNVDYLFGKVTFNSTQGTSVTADITYLPLQPVAGGNSFSLSHTADLLDNTDFESTGYRYRVPNFRDVSLTVTRWDSLERKYFESIIKSTEPDSVLVEIDPDQSTTSGPRARGYFLVESENRSGDVDSLESAEVSFQLDADARDSYRWSDN